MDPPTVNLDAAFVCENLDCVLYFLLTGSQALAKHRKAKHRRQGRSEAFPGEHEAGKIFLFGFVVTH